MTEADWIAFFRRPEIPAFNAKMLEHPDADLPRLVFADWVEENCPDTAFVTAVRESIADPKWYTVLPELPLSEDLEVSVRRGRLVLRLQKNLPPPKPRSRKGLFPVLWRSGWVGGTDIWRTSPAVSKSWLTDPQMAFVERLRLGNQGGVARAKLLAEARHLTALTGLVLSGEMLETEGLRILAGSANWHRLKSLDLSSNGVSDDGMRVIASAESFAGLIRLSLENNWIGVAGVETLGSSPHLNQLDTLNLSSNELTEDAVAELAESPLLARLSDLDLARNRIRASGVRSLCGSSRVERLKRLCITGNSNPGPEGMRALAECPHLAGLTVLEVGANWAEDDGVRALAGSPHLARLQLLDLRFSQMTENGAKALAASAHLRELRELDVAMNKIGDAGFLALLVSPVLERVTRLELSDCGITGVGAKALAASPRLANLTRLGMMLGQNDYGVGGATAMAESPHLHHESDREYFRKMAEWFRHRRK